MSEIWPFDVQTRTSYSLVDPIRPFKCLMLMPFEKRFDQVAAVIESTVRQLLETMDPNQGFIGELPHVERLDWVTTSGVIQQEIWQKTIDADLVFCDITGYNPNVMFESGVCAAWKDMVQVVFIKDRFFKQQSAFDISPIRYTEYELTSDGLQAFQQKIAKLTQDVLIRFPDSRGNPPGIELPLEISFADNRDDLRVYTPPFAHRRVVDQRLEFGSILSFGHSWASVGKEALLNFNLEFTARFSNPRPDGAWMGVGLRSQNFFANYSHLLYLNQDGRIVITEPNEKTPPFYKDIILRPPMTIDLAKSHIFQVLFNESELSIRLDDFYHTFQVASMEKVFGPGLIRFQSYGTWMALEKLKAALA